MRCSCRAWCGRAGSRSPSSWASSSSRPSWRCASGVASSRAPSDEGRARYNPRRVPPEDPATLKTRRVYEGKVLSLDLDEVPEPGGVRATREVVRHRGSAACLAVHDDGSVVLI